MAEAESRQCKATKRWAKHLQEQGKQPTRKPATNTTQPTIGQEFVKFKKASRFLATNSDDQLFRSMFRANVQEGRNRLSKLGVRGHHSDIRVQPEVDQQTAKDINKAIARCRKKMPRD